MLDILLFREHPEVVRESQKKRFASVELVDEIIALDEKWRKDETQRVWGCCVGSCSCLCLSCAPCKMVSCMHSLCPPFLSFQPSTTLSRQPRRRTACPRKYESCPR